MGPALTGGMTPQTFAGEVLRGVGAPITSANIKAIVGWENAEGGHWHNNATYNPLNTTEGAPGGRPINGVGVKAYTNWAEGVNATVATLKNGHYGQILGALHQGNDPLAVARAIGSSPWGTNAGLVMQTVSRASGEIPPGIGNSMKSQAQQRSGTAASASGASLSGAGGTDYTSAGIDAMLQAAAKPLSSTGNLTETSNNPLQNLLANVESGAYGAGASSKPVSVPAAVNPAGNARIEPGIGSHAGDVYPIPGATVGRTDMGVDANLPVGHPILALNDSRVVKVIPNWYQGQPLVEMQLLAGPNKGKDWYVAEQITGIPRIGTIVRRGAPVARYAPSGTGIEIGWGANNGLTLAQAQGVTNPAQGHANTPAGQSFAGELNRTR